MAKGMSKLGDPAAPVADLGNFASSGVDLLLAVTRWP